jgi:hypothetical protein
MCRPAPLFPALNPESFAASKHPSKSMLQRYDEKLLRMRCFWIRTVEQLAWGRFLGFEKSQSIGPTVTKWARERSTRSGVY